MSFLMRQKNHITLVPGSLITTNTNLRYEISLNYGQLLQSIAKNNPGKIGNAPSVVLVIDINKNTKIATVSVKQGTSQLNIGVTSRIGSLLVNLDSFFEALCSGNNLELQPTSFTYNPVTKRFDFVVTSVSNNLQFSGSFDMFTDQVTMNKVVINGRDLNFYVSNNNVKKASSQEIFTILNEVVGPAASRGLTFDVDGIVKTGKNRFTFTLIHNAGGVQTKYQCVYEIGSVTPLSAKGGTLGNVFKPFSSFWRFRTSVGI